MLDAAGRVLDVEQVMYGVDIDLGQVTNRLVVLGVLLYQGVAWGRGCDVVDALAAFLAEVLGVVGFVEACE